MLKASFFFWVGQGTIPWSNGVRRAASDHSCKHLLSALMEYADPDIEQFFAYYDRSKDRREAIIKLYEEMRPVYEALSFFPQLCLYLEFARYVRERNALAERLNTLEKEVARLRQQEEEEGLSSFVADAINILRHKKVGYWDTGHDFYDKEDMNEPRARAIAEGSRDREKQRALYIGVGKNGRVCSRPEEVRKDIIAQAFDRSKKLCAFLKNLLQGGGGIQFDRLIKNLKVMFTKLGARAQVFSEPTGWQKVDRQLQEVRLRLDTANSEEQYQAVGLLCREVLISVFLGGRR